MFLLTDFSVDDVDYFLVNSYYRNLLDFNFYENVDEVIHAFLDYDVDVCTFLVIVCDHKDDVDVIRILIVVKNVVNIMHLLNYLL